MRRSILTGLFACLLATGLPAISSAHTTGDAAAPAAATAAAASAIEAAQPTAGADLAMWNAAPEKVEAPAPQPAAQTRTVSRLLHIQKFAGGIAARGAAMASVLTRNAMRFLGVPYAFGGTSAYGFDCSGYVQHVFAMMGLHLPRTADAQYAAAHGFKGTPKAGDLVFFQTYAEGVSHVGISLGGDKFVHASSSHGVMVSSLHDSYWSARYLGARRVVE